MKELAIWIFSWDDEANKKMHRQFEDWYGNEYGLFIWDDTRYHESQALNRCIEQSFADGFEFFHLANADVRYDHHPTIPAMLQRLKEAPKAGLIRPWIQGEPMNPDGGVEEKYVEDGTAITLRLSTSVRFDEEFLATGYSDIDLGNELAYRGWLTLHDRRYPVWHKSHPRDSSSFLAALIKRNKLILDIKWYRVGRTLWQGVDAFNATVPIEEQIPSMNWLMTRSDSDLQVFQKSIHPEHQQVLDKDKESPEHGHGGRNPNLVWRNPLLIGYSTRERFEREHGEF